MLKSLTVLLLLFVTISSKAIELTDKDIDQYLKANKNVVIEFYAKWCQHCKDFAQTYDEIAVELKEKNIPVVKIDAGKYESIANRYKIQGFPTIKFIQDGTKVEYKGDSTKQGVIDWVLKQMSPSFAEINTLEELEQAKKQNELMALLIANRDSEEVQSILQLSKKITISPVKFYVQYKEDKQFQPRFIIYKQYDEQQSELKDKLTKRNMRFFIYKHSMRQVQQFSQNVAKLLQHVLDKMMVFVLDPTTKEHNEKVLSILEDIKQKYKDQLQFVYLYLNEKDLTGAFEQGLGRSIESPEIILQKVGNNVLETYEVNKEFTRENIENYISQFLQNKLQRIIKSEPIPEKNDEIVRTVVYNSFEQEVEKSDKKYTLVFYHADWCGYCVQLMPTYKKLAQALKDQNKPQLDQISFVIYNGDKNDEIYPLEGFPTLVLYVKGQSPILKKSGSNSRKSLINFLRKNTDIEASIWDTLIGQKNKATLSDNVKIEQVQEQETKQETVKQEL